MLVKKRGWRPIRLSKRSAEVCPSLLHRPKVPGGLALAQRRRLDRHSPTTAFDPRPDPPQTRRVGLEGIISKLARSPYRPRRTTEWLKVKCLLRQEMVIGGWQESDKQGRSLKSLLLGYYDHTGRLRFAGKAGTGFALKLGHDLVARLRKIERRDPPFAVVPSSYLRGSRWAEPRLVAEIAYSNWTTDQVMRHPKFVGLREDKAPREVRREAPK